MAVKIKETEENFEKSYKEKLKEKDDEIKLLIEENIKLKTINSIYKDEHDLLHVSYKEDREHIKELSKKPVSVINNSNNSNLFVNNIIDDISKLKEQINTNLNIGHVVNGQKGIANFAFNNLLKDEHGNKTYTCTDPSRGFFKFMNEYNAIVKDFHAKHLTRNMCKAGLIAKVNELFYTTFQNEDGNIDKNTFEIVYPKTVEINDLENNNTAFKNELISYTM